MQAICPNCKSINPGTNKFCGKCGVSLESAELVQKNTQPIQKTSRKKSNLESLLIILSGIAIVCFVCTIIGVLVSSIPTNTSVSSIPTNTSVSSIATNTSVSSIPTNIPIDIATKETPTMNVEELKATVKQIPYDELARNTESHIGEIIYYKGKVFQVIEESGQKMGLLVKVTEDEYGIWDDLVWVNYEGPRLLEDDIIHFWGKVEGRYSYITVLGATVTIPEITALELSFIESMPTQTSIDIATKETPIMNVEEIKATAKQIPYDELARNTESYIGEIIYYKGKVVQVIEESGQKMGLRVEVTEGEYGIWDDLVWVNYEGPRLLEDDIIHFWGRVEGRYSYITVLGATVTIPEITALELSIIK